ncbi:ATP-binding protein [Haloferax sp. DFSO52]|uniref:ATP-binding protein n=1 Tax=Haloferax sp. DFSO52 TaxID=3388505 RepID=UPI003A860681
MTDSSLQLEEIDIRRAPGFDDGGFSAGDFSPEINIIHGPNASGKTTLANSIRALLWPRSANEQTSLIGQYSIGDEDWRVDMAAQSASFQLNGKPANGPNLPPIDQRNRYQLSLHHLLQSNTQNKSFAKQIQQESIGGYDLGEAYDSLAFKNSPGNRNLTEYKRADKAQKAWQQAKRGSQQLQKEKERLPMLNVDLEEAKQAESKVELLGQAIEYAEARNDLQEAEAHLEDFPAILEDIRGTEVDRVDEIESSIEEQQRVVDSQRRQRDQAKETLSEVGLPDSGLSEGLIEGLKSRRDKLDSLEQEKENHERTLASAQERRQKAVNDIPADIGGEDLSSVDPATWREISEFLKAAQRVHAKREAYDAVDKWLADVEQPEQDTESLRQGRQALENWLSTPTPASEASGKTAFRVAAVSAVIVGASSVLLGVLVNPVFFSLLLVATGLFYFGYRSRDNGDDSTNAKQTYKESFARLSLEPPASWESDEVRSRLTELYQALADAQLAEQRKERRKALTSDRATLEEQEADLETKRAELRNRIGISPETDAELAAITDSIRRWQDANDDVSGAQAELESVIEQIESTCEKLSNELEPYGYESVDDSATATKSIRNLESRQQSHREATNELERAKEDIEAAREELTELRREREDIYTTCGLSVGEADELRRLCEQVEEYAEAKQAVDKHQSLLEKEASELESYPSYDPTLKEHSITELETRKSDAEEIASKKEDLQHEITEIETKIEGAEGDSGFEEAVANKQRALDALADRLKEDAEAMVGDVLVDHVSAATEDSNRPAVFEDAQAILTRITNGRYKLDVDNESFFAYDTVKERGFALDELSSATRLQVLLSVRVAFIQQQEQGAKLPILLDETLANTDDERAEAVIDSMIELARDGRQIFYFTAQGSEVSKWKQALDNDDRVDHEIIDLGAIQGATNNVEIPDFGILGTTKAVPAANGESHAQYGSVLDVPPFSPRQGAGSAHLWYLVEDTDLLYHLLEMGIEHWGQLKTLLNQNNGTAVIDDDEQLEAIQLNGIALEEFVKSWRVGRGKRVDRSALEKTGAVTESFIDQVSELAEEVDGNAMQIISGLQDGKVNRFRTRKIDELEEFFEQNGYIEEQETLDADTIRVRVVTRLASAGLQQEEARERGRELFIRLQSRS